MDEALEAPELGMLALGFASPAGAPETPEVAEAVLDCVAVPAI